MATPLGHSLAGYAVFAFFVSKQTSKRTDLKVLCLLLAIAPDLDFLPGLLMGSPALYHQGVTHSLGFGLMFSMGIAWVWSLRGGEFSNIIGLFSVSYISHLILDFFGPDGRLPYGIPLFWPLSGEYFISPIRMFWGMHHVGSTHASILEWINGIFSLYNLQVIAFEIVVITPLIFLGQWHRRRSLV